MEQHNIFIQEGKQNENQIPVTARQTTLELKRKESINKFNKLAGSEESSPFLLKSVLDVTRKCFLHNILQNIFLSKKHKIIPTF